MKSGRVSVPHRVGDLLVAAVPALAERMLVDELRRDWPTLVGPALARRSAPAALDHGVLEIRADNSPWLMELQMRAGELLDALTRRHGRSVVSLRFALGEVSVPAPAAASPARPAPRPALGAEDARDIERTTAALQDPALAGALRRLLIKDRLARRQRSSASVAEKDFS
jgi:hypothetical protein